MAKTKRRQLAALVALAELRDLNIHADRIASCQLSGPSGAPAILQDPMVEIRKQRVIFKIPALPPKPPRKPRARQSKTLALPSETPALPDKPLALPRKRTLVLPQSTGSIKKKVMLGKRRRKLQMEMDLDSDLVPADEAKISKVILKLGKWKREKSVGDLLAAGAKSKVSTLVSNGDKQQPGGQSLASTPAKSTASTLVSNGDKQQLAGQSLASSPAKSTASTLVSNGNKQQVAGQPPASGPGKSKASTLVSNGDKQEPAGQSQASRPAKSRLSNQVSNRDEHQPAGQSPASVPAKSRASTPVANGDNLQPAGKSPVSGTSKPRASSLVSNEDEHQAAGKSLANGTAKSRASLLASKGDNQQVGGKSVGGRRAKSRPVTLAPNEEKQQPGGKSLGSGPQLNGTAQIAVPRPAKRGRPRKAPVALKSPRKRLKLQEVLVRSPPARQVDLLEFPGGLTGVTKQAADGAAASQGVISEDQSSKVPPLVDKNRPQEEQAKVTNGVVAHPQARKRRGGSVWKVTPKVPKRVKPASPIHHATATKVSNHAAAELDGLGDTHVESQRIVMKQKVNLRSGQSERTLIKGKGNLSNASLSDRVIVRSSADGEAVLNTGRQNGRKRTFSSVQAADLLPGVIPTVHPSHENKQNGLHTLHDRSVRSNGHDDVQPQLQVRDQHHVCIPDLGFVAKQGNAGPKQLLCSGGQATKLRGAELLKQQTQVAIVQNRLDAVGGMEKWLHHNGLEQFVPIFEKWKIDHLALLQLTMAGLKVMGLGPVGPRRKLIHAISSLSQPSFFKQFTMISSA